MKIYPQIDDNDCGISVTQSLINYFFNEEIKREQIFSKANITKEGVTLLELEKINESFGVILDSYHLTFEEFKDLKIKDYFVTIINSGGKAHYVIGKKYKKYVELFDSEKGKIFVKYDQFKNIFLHVFITVKKNKTFNSKEIQSPKKTYWDKSFLIKSFAIDLLCFIFMLVNCLTNKLFFVDAISTKNLKNLGIIFFLSILICFTWSINEYLKIVFLSKYKKHYLKSIYKKLFDSLKNKINFFYQKVGKTQFLYLQQHIQNIASFCTEHIAAFIFNLTLILAIFAYLCWMNVQFIFIIFLSFLIQFSYAFSIFLTKKELLPTIINSSHRQRKLFFDLHNFLNEEWNLHKLNVLTSSLETEVIEEINVYESMNSKNILFEKFNFFIFNLSIVFIYGFLVFKSWLGLINLEAIINVGFLYYQLNHGFKKIIEIMFFYHIYQKSLSAYLLWINSNNIEDKKMFDFFVPKFIQIKQLTYSSTSKEIFKNLNLILENGTFIFGKSGSGKSTLYKLLTNKKFLEDKCIFLDEVSIQEIDQNQFNFSVIYQTSNSFLENFNLQELFKKIDNQQKELIIVLLKNMDIELKNHYSFSELSSGQKQFLNIIQLLQYEKKILFLDEIASHINAKNKKIIFKKIIPLLTSKNFVVCSEHDWTIKKFFKKCINLNDFCFI